MFGRALLHLRPLTMKPISIFNDVLGPVMRGPSSSHTAGSYHIGRLARSLFGEQPQRVIFTFDPSGSYAEVYREQNSDRAFAAAFLDWSITDGRFLDALTEADAAGIELRFTSDPLPGADHPNVVQIRMESRAGRELTIRARSIGGGAVSVDQVQGWPVHLSGDAYDLLVELPASAEDSVRAFLEKAGVLLEELQRESQGELVLLHARYATLLEKDIRLKLSAIQGVCSVWLASPIFFVPRGKALFTSAAEMTHLAQARACSLGQAALAYEAELLGLSQAEVLAETLRRYAVMYQAVQRGLDENLPPMRLLQPTARAIYQAQASGRLAFGGMHSRAAARAMAVMHVNSGAGVVCAAPTAGSAGTLPGTLVTLAEELSLTDEQIALALLAASAVGVIIATRATFAAEVGGCQVEIGAAGAMAAAAAVEAAGGSATQAADAAAIAFQNTMGTICDPVQGIVEIPCHTRNAVAAASAFVCADLIMGGYQNPISLDETIDAMYAVGRMLPRELKCTALGGLAQTPSALKLRRID
jgi:L-serine dehydratase